MAQAPEGVTALILAGGRGSRMGGIDKGLQNFRGLPLALQTLMRLQLQSLPPQEILINANRNLAAYESLGAAVWPDTLDGFFHQTFTIGRLLQIGGDGDRTGQLGHERLQPIGTSRGQNHRCANGMKHASEVNAQTR